MFPLRIRLSFIWTNVLYISGFRVKHKPDFSTFSYFMSVRDHHSRWNVLLLVMVFETTWRELLGDDFVVELWKSCTWISS